MKINEVITEAGLSPGYNMTPQQKMFAELGRLMMDIGEKMPMGKGVSDEAILLSMDIGQIGSDMVHGYINDGKEITAAAKKARSDTQELMKLVNQAVADYKAGKRADVAGQDVEADPEDDADEFGSDDDEKIARQADRMARGK
jgi:hypothetical protein